MERKIGNYAKHAQYWDWSGHDRSTEQEYWLKFAKRYGKNVLIPMCALSETGAYMAEHDMYVTAFDITPEMISEGRKRFGDVPGLRLLEGDICDFSFDIPPADFCFVVDFGHILTIEDIRRALVCIHKHLRLGGCLAIGTGFRDPDDVESVHYPEKTFHPLKQIYPDLKVWKTGDSRKEGATGRFYISQTFYAEDADGHIESFDHSFYLQSYTREAWLNAIKQSGFEIKKEHKGDEGTPWDDDGWYVLEAIKI